MLPATFAPLAAAAAWALPTAVLAQWVPAVGAALAVAGLLSALQLRHRLRHAGLCALPVLLAAWPPPASPRRTLPPGPTAVQGTVQTVVRWPQLARFELGFGEAEPRIVFAGDAEVLPGDRVRLLARAPEPAIPGQPTRLQGVTATLEVIPGQWSVPRLCAALRRRLELQLLRLAPGEAGPTLASLVLGHATRPDSEVLSAHRATGLSHLLAVSGAHAAMLAVLLGMSRRGQRLASPLRRVWSVLLLLALYGGIAGAEPPVLRAVFGAALAVLAARLGRPCGIAATLLLPACVTCLVEPAALRGASFQLSYAAVLGLWLAGANTRAAGPLGWLGDAMRCSAWATLLTAPCTLFYFGQLAPWTVLLTPLCAPLVAVLLLLGLVSASATLLAPALEAVFRLPLTHLTAVYTGIVHAADHLPGTPIPAHGTPPPWALALAAGALLTAVLLRQRRSTLASGLVAICALWFVPWPAAAGDRLQLFAVGHGQAALCTIRDGEQVLIDCGSMQASWLSARRVIDALPGRHLALLVVTHADDDHHNGVDLLLERCSVAAAILPHTLADSALRRRLDTHGARLRIVAPGERFSPCPGVEVLAPNVPPAAGDNDRSLWLTVRLGSESGATTVVVTGDAQELGTAAALADGLPGCCDVLVLPHHGRPNRLAPRLLAALRPRACFASASSADGDTWFAPFVRRAGAELWVTGRHGTLTLTTGPPAVQGDAGPRPLPAR